MASQITGDFSSEIKHAAFAVRVVRIRSLVRLFVHHFLLKLKNL